VLHLAKSHAGRWRIDQLERLARPSVARNPDQQPHERKDLDTRIRDIEGERRVVDAAHRATTTRLRELRAAGADPKRLRELRRQRQTWKARREELDTELDQVRTTRRLRDQLADLDLPSRRHPTELDDTQLEQLLGPQPDHEWRRGLRDGLIDEIHTYRRRCNVTDPRNVLGAIPTDLDHRGDRDELADTLRAAAKALGTRSRPGLGRDDEATRRTDRAHDRDVAAER
jgi:hypothetical protein